MGQSTNWRAPVLCHAMLIRHYQTHLDALRLRTHWDTNLYFQYFQCPPCTSVQVEDTKRQVWHRQELELTWTAPKTSSFTSCVLVLVAVWRKVCDFRARKVWCESFCYSNTLINVENSRRLRVSAERCRLVNPLPVWAFFQPVMTLRMKLRTCFGRIAIFL